MIMVDTSRVTLDEIDEMFLNMSQHVDQVLAKEHLSSFSTFVYVKSKREIDYTLDNMTRQLESLSAALSSSLSPNGSRYELGSRGREVVVTMEDEERKKLLLELWRRSSHFPML